MSGLNKQSIHISKSKENEFNSAIIDTLDNIVIVIDKFGKIIKVNKSFENVTGYKYEEVHEKPFWEIILKNDDVETIKEVFTSICKGDFPNRNENYITTKHGIRLINWSNNALTDKDGNVEFVLATGIDITNERRNKEAHENALAKYKSLVEQIPVVSYISGLDSDHSVFYISPQIEKLTGYTQKECISDPNSWKSRLHPDDAKRVIETLKLARKNNSSFHCEYRLLTKDESIVWVSDESVIVYDEISKLTYVQGVITDITARKTAERNLRMQTSAINAASDQIIITDASGNIEFVNPAFEKETFYRSDEVLGKKTNVLKSGKHDEKYYESMWQTISSGDTWQNEMANKRKDGSLTIEDVSITPITNDQGIIEHYIAIKRNINDKKVYQEKLDHLAHHDVLTGLPNRLTFSNKLVEGLARIKNTNKLLAVMFIDLDRFKLVNDTLGHKIGDLLLESVASTFINITRDKDTLARTGGDEFMMIIPDIDRYEDAANIGNRILQSLSKPFYIEGHELFVSASIGISVAPYDGTDVESLVKNADIAMYKAKEFGGNNCYRYTKKMNTVAVEKITLENGLRRALDRNEFELYYQPKLDIKSGNIMGVEALIRWQHPELGLISPTQFIPLAEDTGLIVPISKWVLNTACMQAKKWQDEGHKPMDIAVNISARQFHNSILFEDVCNSLKAGKLDPQYLSLELTESILMQNPDHVIETLKCLKKIGVNTSIDDFGTGYSSLGYLRHLPINAIKVDRVFIKDICTNTEDQALANVMVAMAHCLNLKIVAEGVETLGQLRLLDSMDYDQVQGYLVSRPLPADKIGMILDKHLSQINFFDEQVA